MKKLTIIIILLILSTCITFADSDGQKWLIYEGANESDGKVYQLLYKDVEGQIVAFDYYDENGDYEQFKNTFVFYDSGYDMIAVYKLGFFKLVCIYSDWD